MRWNRLVTPIRVSNLVRRALLMRRKVQFLVPRRIFLFSLPVFSRKQLTWLKIGYIISVKKFLARCSNKAVDRRRKNKSYRGGVYLRDTSIGGIPLFISLSEKWSRAKD